MQDKLKGTLAVNLIQNPDAASTVEVAGQILARVIADHRPPSNI
jgi:hypothetical protein